MPVSINNTTLTFNDATTQTTAPVNTSANVNSVAAGTGISVNQTTGAVTVTNSGVTSLTAGTGISVSAATGGITITNSAPAGGGVTSLNGQTGAITDTNLGAIGSYISAVRAVAAEGSPLFANSTIAGSSLRYGYSASATYGGYVGAFGAPFRSNNANYNSGGSSLSGTWRNLGTAYEYDNGEGSATWYPSLYVRIS
jgi:hypothetical protein